MTIDLQCKFYKERRSAYNLTAQREGAGKVDTEQLYKDIKARTHGEIYIGVVGPVRTGKSTFIKRFMDVMVLPRMEDEHMKEQTRDELPQSAAGKTIMTTEPKFVPKDAAVIHLNRDVEVKVRLIDCVGYLVKGASGYEEAGHERMVKTPWYREEIPFTKAAVTGTQKVIREHATIGIVVTTDGTVTDIQSENYEDAEARTIRELQSIRKPFVVLVNSKKPQGQEAKEKVRRLEDTYQVRAMTVNCEQIKEEDIYRILEAVLYEFPVSEVQFYIPKWVEMLPAAHKIKQDLLEHIQKILGNLEEIRDAVSLNGRPDSSYIKDWYVEQIQMDTGCVIIRIHMYEKYYYEMLSEMTGTTITGQYDLIKTMQKLSMLKNEYENVEEAFTAVRMKGYGVVSPTKEEIILDEPEIIRQGNKYGVKIHSQAPSIHLIRANIETEIAPIVGNEQQAEDLIRYIKKEEKMEGGIWKTSIFGKTVEELVMDGLKNKIAVINEESQEKLQDSMQKIVNDSNGGMVCIII